VLRGNGGLEENNLDTLVTEEELRYAVFGLNGDKAPGPDGFPLFFYQQFWAEIKDSLLMVVHDFKNSQCDLKCFLLSTLTLIQKKEDSKTVKDYRPISL